MARTSPQVRIRPLSGDEFIENGTPVIPWTRETSVCGGVSLLPRATNHTRSAVPLSGRILHATLIISPKSILGNALMSTPLSQHDHRLRGNQSNPFRIVNLSSLLYYCDTTSCSAIGISFSKELNSAVVYLSVLASSSWPYWPWSFRQSFRLRYGMSFQVSSRNSFTVVTYFNPVGIQLTLKSRKESKQLSLSVVSWRHFFS